MTDLGPLNYFLGISISRDSSGLFLSQKKYVVEILDMSHIVNCNPNRTPIDTESKLGSEFSRFLCISWNNFALLVLKHQPDVSRSMQRQSAKHIEIDIHFVQDLVAAGHVRVLHVPSLNQFADIFTKGLPSALFEKFLTSLSIWCPPALTAEEC
ncbi:ribonuclease H-like domain-containing protein [Tanacetum coccineum]